MYCPDNGAQCTPLVQVGGHCELVSLTFFFFFSVSMRIYAYFIKLLQQRDDECAGKESICLNSTCFVKGAPLGGNCGSDR